MVEPRSASLFLHENVIENVGAEFAADFDCLQLDYSKVRFKKLSQFIFGGKIYNAVHIRLSVFSRTFETRILLAKTQGKILAFRIKYSRNILNVLLPLVRKYVMQQAPTVCKVPGLIGFAQLVNDISDEKVTLYAFSFSIFLYALSSE